MRRGRGKDTQLLDTCMHHSSEHTYKQLCDDKEGTLVRVTIPALSSRSQRVSTTTSSTAHFMSLCPRQAPLLP